MILRVVDKVCKNSSQKEHFAFDSLKSPPISQQMQVKMEKINK